MPRCRFTRTDPVPSPVRAATAAALARHGSRAKAGPRGDLRARHAFDQAQDQRFAIGLRQAADEPQGLFRFRRRRSGAAQRARKFDGRRRPPVMIDGRIPRDGRNPSAERTRISQHVQLLDRAEKHLLRQIVGVLTADTRQQEPVDHRREALVQPPERAAIARAGAVHQRGDGRRFIRFADGHHLRHVPRLEFQSEINGVQTGPHVRSTGSFDHIDVRRTELLTMRDTEEVSSASVNRYGTQASE